MSESIKVIVRSRPLNKSEISKNCKECINLNFERKEAKIFINNNKESERTFTMDNVYNHTITQKFIYENSAFPIIEQVFSGYNGTIFAYGQTGCGKTYSMMGLPNDDIQKGIIPRSFDHILSIIASEKNKKFLVLVSFIEIYNELIHDLLSSDIKEKKELKEDPKKGVYVKDLSKIKVNNIEEMIKYMNIGNNNRSVGATEMNSESSRSHSIFTLFVESSEEIGEELKFTSSKLNLVDLAGSERQSKTKATGSRLKEANKINLSLSALGNVIQALVDGKSKHIPYRDSKLTRLLQDSLGGNTKTLMIAAVSPADYNFDESLSTLRYANRAKNIKNKPQINEDPKDTLLKEYLSEIQKLKDKLKNKNIKKVNPQKLKQENNSFDEKNELNNQKFEKELEEEKKKQELLLKKLKDLESNTLHIDENKNNNIEINFNRKQLIKKQSIIEEKNKLEEEEKEKLINLKNIDKNLLEENYKKLLNLYKNKELELKDSEEEHLNNKFELNEYLRDQKKEAKFLTALILKLINEKELNKLRINTKWSDRKSSYILPSFLIKNKRIKLSNLTKNDNRTLWDNIKENRNLVFLDADSNKEEDKSNFENSKSDFYQKEFEKPQIKPNFVENYNSLKKNNNNNSQKFILPQKNKDLPKLKNISKRMKLEPIRR